MRKPLVTIAITGCIGAASSALYTVIVLGVTPRAHGIPAWVSWPAAVAAVFAGWWWSASLINESLNVESGVSSSGRLVPVLKDRGAVRAARVRVWISHSGLGAAVGVLSPGAQVKAASIAVITVALIGVETLAWASKWVKVATWEMNTEIRARVGEPTP